MVLRIVTLLIILTEIILGTSSPVWATDRPSVKADSILVEKSARKLSLFVNDNLIKIYKITLGKNPTGHKVEQGDQKTPEGIYTIDFRNKESKFHLSLHISYPNEIDLFFAEKLGVSPGGDIMIHGVGKEYAWMGKYHIVHNWTDGCIAVTNEEIEELWDLIPDGTTIKIVP